MIARIVERGWPTLLVLAGLRRARARQRRAGAGRRRSRSSSSPPRPPSLPSRHACRRVRWRSFSPAGGGGASDSTRSTAACSRPRSGARRSATVVVTGPARKTPFALRVPAEVRRFDRAPLRERVLLELPVGRSPPQGAVLALRVTVAAPRGAEDGFDERGWLARRGVHVVLHGGDWRIVGRRGGIGGVSDRLRAHVARAIAPGLGGERRAVLAGIVLGEDEGLTDELRANFKASGLYHLLAVSGQNVAFLAIGVLGLAWLLGIHRLAAEVAAIGAIAAYVLAVGWQPSVVRAGVAGGLASLAWLLARPRDRWHFLALGAAVLLAWTPASLFEPGFQLSFAAVGAIFLLLPRLRLALEGYPLPAWLRDALAVSTACGAATAPILWLQFGSVPVYSLLANALVALAIGPLLGLALVGSLRRAVAAVGGARARLGERLARRVHRRVRGARRRAPARRRSAPARPSACCSEPRSPCSRSSGCRGGGGRRRWRAPRPSFPLSSSGSSALRVAAAAERAPHHVPRRRPGRLDPPAGARGRAARRPRPARGERRTAAPHARRAAAAPRSSSRIRSATTSAAPRPCCAGSPSTACSIRSWRGRASTSRLLWPRQRSTASRSSRRGRAIRSGSAGCTCACSGRIGPGRRARIRTGSPIVLLATYGEVDALLTADAETDVTARLLVAARRDPQGRAPRLRRRRPRERAARAAARGRGDLVRPWQRLRPPARLDPRGAAREPRAQPLPHGRGRSRRRRVGWAADHGPDGAVE